MIAGDREELLRLFENLIENALKYGASGGKVMVSSMMDVSPDGAPEFRVMVRDFGPGIAPEHLPRLTERFYRVDAGDSRAQGGTGLGLSLVKHILNRHRRPPADRKRARPWRDLHGGFSTGAAAAGDLKSNDCNGLSLSSNCRQTFVKAASTALKRTP